MFMTLILIITYNFGGFYYFLLLVKNNICDSW